jgi:transglutaminase-like putative cysteine protease
MSKFFKKIDVFGAPVGVNYNGSETYQTKMGACCTLLSILIVLLYAG